MIVVVVVVVVEYYVVGHAQESGACGDERKNDRSCQAKEGVVRRKKGRRRRKNATVGRTSEGVFKREKGRWIPRPP